MTRVQRPCLTCGAPCTASRCPSCTRARQRVRDAWRGSARQRGYNAEYERNRKLVLAASDGVCAWCHRRPATTVDHTIPLAKGGTNEIGNLIPSCGLCNASRGSRPAPSDWIRSARG